MRPCFNEIMMTLPLSRQYRDVTKMDVFSSPYTLQNLPSILNMSDLALYGKSAAGSSNPPIIQIPSGVTTVPKFCLLASTGLNLIGILAPDSSVVN